MTECKDLFATLTEMLRHQGGEGGVPSKTYWRAFEQTARCDFLLDFSKERKQAREFMGDRVYNRLVKYKERSEDSRVHDQALDHFRRAHQRKLKQDSWFYVLFALSSW
jgi:hypothetical protein